MDFVKCTNYLGEGAEGNNLLDGRWGSGKGVTEQVGEEENPNFPKAEVAMSVVLSSGAPQGSDFQEMSLKSMSFQSFLDQAYKMAGFF